MGEIERAKGEKKRRKGEERQAEEWRANACVVRREAEGKWQQLAGGEEVRGKKKK